MNFKQFHLWKVDDTLEDLLLLGVEVKQLLMLIPEPKKPSLPRVGLSPLLECPTVAPVNINRSAI